MLPFGMLWLILTDLTNFECTNKFADHVYSPANLEYVINCKSTPQNSQIRIWPRGNNKLVARVHPVNFISEAQWIQLHLPFMIYCFGLVLSPMIGWHLQSKIRASLSPTHPAEMFSLFTSRQHPEKPDVDIVPLLPLDCRDEAAIGSGRVYVHLWREIGGRTITHVFVQFDQVQMEDIGC